MSNRMDLTVCDWLSELRKQKAVMEDSAEKLQDYISSEEHRVNEAKKDLESKEKMIKVYAARIALLQELQTYVCEEDFISQEVFEDLVKEILKKPQKPIPCPPGITAQ